MSSCQTLFTQLYSEFQRTGQITGGQTRPMTDEEIVEFNSHAVDLFQATQSKDNHWSDFDVRRGELIWLENCELDPEDTTVTSARIRGNHQKGELEINECDGYSSEHELIRADEDALIGFSGFSSRYATCGWVCHINRADLERSSITEWSFDSPRPPLQNG